MIFGFGIGMTVNQAFLYEPHTSNWLRKTNIKNIQNKQAHTHTHTLSYVS